MRARVYALLIAGTVLACSSKHDPDRLRRVEAAASTHSQAVDDVTARAARLSIAWDDVRAGFAQATRANLAAQATLMNASETYGAASLQFREATAVATRASARWQLFQQLVIAAALLDAANFDTARAAAEGSANALSCDAGMSTAAFRTVLIAQGVNLTGMDIDHIVPRALGGADNAAQLPGSPVIREPKPWSNVERGKVYGRRPGTVRASYNGFSEMRKSQGIGLYMTVCRPLEMTVAFEGETFSFPEGTDDH